MAFMAGGRRLLVAALLLLVAVFANLAIGRTVLELDTAAQPVPLQDWGDAWTDETGRTPVDQVATDGSIAWTPTRPDAIYPLSTGKALWFRFTVPPASDSERWYLEIPYPSVNGAILYTFDSAGQWVPQSAGDRFPVADWPVPHRHPLLPVFVSAESPAGSCCASKTPTASARR
jgi:hypothetical protein